MRNTLWKKNMLWTESILSIDYKRAEVHPAGKHGLDILSDLFRLLNGRLDIFRRIYIKVPKAGLKKISPGNQLGLTESPQRDSTIKFDNALHLCEFRWSGNFDLLKDKFQIPFTRSTSLSLLCSKINVDDASLILAKCLRLRELEIGTLIQTDNKPKNACKMPRTWWRHSQLRFTCLESLMIASAGLLEEFTSRLALNYPMCGLKKLSLTLYTEHASCLISELYFPWSLLKTVDIRFQLGLIPVEKRNSLNNDLTHKLSKSANLRIEESQLDDLDLSTDFCTRSD